MIDKISHEFAEKTLTDFQLREYENIAQAHFKTNEMISVFYRYYFVIIAIPITTISVIFIASLGNETLYPNIENIQIIIGTLFLIVFVAGLAITIYIEGLNLDSVLYARTVNSVRDYFFNFSNFCRFNSDEPVLPRSKTIPGYNRYGSHFIIFSLCSFLNSTYLGLGIAFIIFIHLRVEDNILNVKYNGSILYTVLFCVGIATSWFLQLQWRKNMGREKEKPRS
jgi:hypothetical protein